MYEPPYPPSNGLNSTTTVLLGEWLWNEITLVDMPLNKVFTGNLCEAIKESNLMKSCEYTLVILVWFGFFLTVYQPSWVI